MGEDGQGGQGAVQRRLDAEEVGQAEAHAGDEIAPPGGDGDEAEDDEEQLAELVQSQRGGSGLRRIGQQRRESDDQADRQRRGARAEQPARDEVRGDDAQGAARSPRQRDRRRADLAGGEDPRRRQAGVMSAVRPEQRREGTPAPQQVDRGAQDLAVVVGVDGQRRRPDGEGEGGGGERAGEQRRGAAASSSEQRQENPASAGAQRPGQLANASGQRQGESASRSEQRPGGPASAGAAPLGCALDRRLGGSAAAAPAEADRRREARDGQQLRPAVEQRRHRGDGRGEREPRHGDEQAGGKAAPRPDEPLRRRPRGQRARHRRRVDVLAVAQEVRHPGGTPSRYYRRGQGNASRRGDADRDDDLGESEPRRRRERAPGRRQRRPHRRERPPRCLVPGFRG